METPEDEKLSKEQITVIMEKIRKEYKETPLETKNLALKNLIKKLEERGFNFEPFSLVKEIDAEADRQFKRLVADTVNGLTVNNLASIKSEIITWYNDEEVRFEAFRMDYLKKAAEAAPEVPSSQVALQKVQEQEKVTPISHGKKKGKK